MESAPAPSPLQTLWQRFEQTEQDLPHLTWALTWIGLIASTIVGVGTLVVAWYSRTPVNLVHGLAAAISVAMHLACLALLAGGRFTWVHYVLPGGLWLLGNSATLLLAAPPAWAMMVNLTVVLCAWLLEQRRAARFYLALSLCLMPLAALAQATDLLQQPAPPIPAQARLVEMALFAWFGMLLVLSWRRLERLESYSAAQTAQLETNQQEIEANRSEQAAVQTFLEGYNRNLQRRLRQFQVAAEVARDAAALNEVDVLLNRSVNLVLERFDFYHAGIFLMDEKGEYAVLKAATGEAGQKMLAGRHKLKVGAEGMVGHVLANGSYRVASDVQEDQVYFKNPYLPKTRSELTLPLKSGSQIIGALDVQSTEANAFDTEDIAILQSMADQLAVAIENARLFEAANRQLDELIALHAVANAATEATDENQLIERVTQVLAETLFTDNFGVMLLDESSQTLNYHPSYRSSRPIDRSPVSVNEGLVGECVRTGRSLRVGDVLAEKRYKLSDTLTRSEMCAPIKLAGRVFGVINTESWRLNDFSREDERVLDTVAGQLATGLQKVRSFVDEHRRALELEALRQASLQVTSSLDLDTVLKAILQNAIRLMNAYTAHIFLYDGQNLRFGMAMWADGEDRTPFSKPKPGGLTQSVAESGKPLAISDVRTHALFTGRAWDGAVIGLPILNGAQVLGVMNLSFDGGAHPFHDHEIQVLQLLADQAAVALLNARLYAESQERAEQLTRALAQREELVRLRNEFIQNVSHELRTPLAITRGYVELLEKEELGPLAPGQLDAVKILNRRVQMLIKLVDDLVTILEAEALDVKVERVNLAELVQRALTDFTPVAKQARLTLRVEIGPGGEDTVVNGTASHLNRVLDNLLSNAIKFTPPDGAITLRLGLNGGRARLEVEDEGIGIPSDKLERIFERFYQVDGTTKRRYGGTGLGLALVKEIIQAHGGQVVVTSELGKGTRFQVEIPLAQ